MILVNNHGTWFVSPWHMVCITMVACTTHDWYPSPWYKLLSRDTEYTGRCYHGNAVSTCLVNCTYLDMIFFYHGTQCGNQPDIWLIIGF